MAHVIFYEKPGCAGNARQKALLVASGHEVEASNMLAEPWTAEELAAYFGERPVAQWFNAASPRIKSGEVKPDVLAPSEALALMIADPLLIRRPLMRVGARRDCGFDMERVNEWIGLAPADTCVSDVCVKERPR
jgi:nitrogenase-associated protein